LSGLALRPKSLLGCSPGLTRPAQFYKDVTFSEQQLTMSAPCERETELMEGRSSSGDSTNLPYRFRHPTCNVFGPFPSTKAVAKSSKVVEAFPKAASPRTCARPANPAPPNRIHGAGADARIEEK